MDWKSVAGRRESLDKKKRRNVGLPLGRAIMLSSLLATEPPKENKHEEPPKQEEKE